jgi:predicted flap endonuclease-1-like 5' DNA nuclease
MDHVFDRLSLNAIKLRRHSAPAVAAPAHGEVDDEGSSAYLFFWGVLTALTLWWLYLRPLTTSRKLNTLRARPRPGPRPGSRPANAVPAQRHRPTEAVITPAEAEPETPAEDDLTAIFGIGPARAARLREAGIGTFAALAVVDAEQLREILSGAVDVSSWPEQASLAAKSDWVGLDALQSQLRAERGQV